MGTLRPIFLILIALSFISILSLLVTLNYLQLDYFFSPSDEQAVADKDSNQFLVHPANDEEIPSQRSLNIAHITPLYGVPDCDSRFCPFNQEQSLVIASMIRAQRLAKSGSINVTLATSVFKEDRHIVPSSFLTLKDLSRSILTEFPDLREYTTKKIPFLGDIFDNLKSDPNYEKFDYIIYTNSDIIVHEDFYNIVESIITTDGYDGFTINRVTLPENDNYTELDLDTIYNLKGRVHPGTDCFIMKRSVFEKIRMGNVFLGHPPVACSLKMQTKAYAEKFKMFRSHHFNATFHLGDPRSWRSEGKLKRKNFEQLNDLHSKRCENRIKKVDVSSP